MLATAQWFEDKGTAIRNVYDYGDDMTIFAQHGFGKGTKIEDGIDDGSLAGVILSPHDETESKINAFITQIASDYPDTTRFVDPQVHVRFARNKPIRANSKLTDYPYWSDVVNAVLPLNSQDRRNIIQACLSWQLGLDVSHAVSPTVEIDAFGGSREHDAVRLAEESIHYLNAEFPDVPMLASFVIDERTLGDAVGVQSWIDTVGELECHGVYLIMRRDLTRYEQTFPPRALMQLLRICYKLTEEYHKMVIVGYTDFVTLLLHAAGAAGTGTGWYFNLRWFAYRRFYESGGGGGTPRYSSFPLLNSILGDELAAIRNRALESFVTTGALLDAAAVHTAGSANGPNSTPPIIRHHWAGLADSIRNMPGQPISMRLDIAEQIVSGAQQVYGRLHGIPFDPTAGSRHLGQWATALANFRRQENV